ncbi:MAG: hypothetical protein SP1CHLAM54_04840 [Chlamydiia bacterium]|nr:hypothetical protein [Chlamydiia bacterium]MCH9615396.1 hypothetical protein [Chlamydiia bacterium]MCH9628282.1 hypothetical protein [Chlamydiia bacterium]
MTKVSEIFDAAEPVCSAAEKALNFPGYIPCVGTLSGGARLILGQVQIALGALCAIGTAVASVVSEVETEKKELWTEAEHSLEFAVHGIANCVRGTIEAMPCVNLITLPYDFINRFEYPTIRNGAEELFPIPTLRSIIAF